MDKDEAIAEVVDDGSPGQPLCLHCFEPYDPLAHYCPRCGGAVGQFTPNIPFVNIGFQCEFWSGAWKQLWSPGSGKKFVRCVSVVLITAMAPVMLLGIPFVIDSRHVRRRNLKLINPMPPRLPTDLPPLEPPPLPPDPPASDYPTRPRYQDRPPFDPR